MPKNPLKGFTRRKSSGNVLDIQPEAAPPSTAPAGSSFRVLERPSTNTGAAGGNPSGVVKRTSGPRPLSELPFSRTKGKSTDDLLSAENRSVEPSDNEGPNTIYGVLKRGRGSGGTALSGSSGYFDNSSSSARYSSSSTLPSSIEAEHDADQDDLFPRKAATSSSNRSSAGSALPEPPSFSTRASRAMSFGLRSKQTPSPAMTQTQQMPDVPENSLIRDRATTMSSYASTAVPPRIESNLQASDFGSDFGNMFEGLGPPRRDDVSAPPAALGNFGRSPRRQSAYNSSNSNNNNNNNNNNAHYNYAYQPRLPQELGPALTHSARNNFTPSPDHEPEPEPRKRPANLTATNRYSWASRTSNDGLMSPGIASDAATPPLQPPSGFARFRPGYQQVPDRYSSPSYDTPPPRAVSSGSSSGGDDDDGAATQAPPQAKPAAPARVIPVSPPSRVAPVAPAKNPTVASVSHDDLSSTGSTGESRNTTPRATHLQPRRNDNNNNNNNNNSDTTTTTNDSMFEVSPAGPTSRTLHPAAAGPIGSRNPSPGLSPSKRMTKLEFEQQRAEVTAYDSDESDASDEGSYDDDDETERQAELARQRRKQEANMAVYRQQMKKVSGGNPSELPSQSRPGFDRASFSAPGLSQGFGAVSLGAEPDEDEEVPLGILQAHGFPNKNRPPVRLASAPSTPGPDSVMGDAGGRLPPFARNLPVDPYFGASIVNPSHRESLAFGSNASVYGGAPAVQPMQHLQPPMPPLGPPQGLVGVIAGEERARAARRASPNSAYGLGPLPLPNNLHHPQMMPRTNSMMSMGGPQMGMGMGMGMGVGMPMMSPHEINNQQQMMQMLQMQQHMMQQMMAMQQGQMTGQMNPPQMLPPPGFGNLPNGMQRPVSMSNSPSANNANPQQHWNGNPQTQRSNTMTNLKPPGYAGSIYDYSLGPPPQGYTPSIAPSERSNVGMPSRYRPVTTEGPNSRTGTMTSESGAAAAFAKKNTATGSLLNPNGAAKSTIKVIEKPKGSPKAMQHRVEDDDDEEGWAALRKRRAERKMKNKDKTSIDQQQEKSLEALYSSFE